MTQRWTQPPPPLPSEGEAPVIAGEARARSSVELIAPPDDPAVVVSPPAPEEGEEWSAEQWLSASDALLFQETLVESSSSEAGFLRGACVTMVDDFTLPAQTPHNRLGQVPEILSLDLFGDTDMTGALRWWTWNDDGSISWIGELTGPDIASDGEVIITVVNGRFAMTARLGTLMWDLRTDPECGYRLEEWDESAPSETEECSTSNDLILDATTYTSGPPVEHGVLPLHPEGALPTIDFLVVGTTETLAQFVYGLSPGDTGIDGLTGYAHNRIHELDLSFIRTTPNRTHRPRLVGLAIETSVLDTDLAGEVITKVKGSVAIDTARELLGADVVSTLTETNFFGLHIGVDRGVNWRPGLASNPNGTPSWNNDGYFVASPGPRSTAKWSFSHEFGHVLGIEHADEPYLPLSGDNGPQAIRGDVQYRGIGTVYPYRDMMSSSSAPGERTPVFGALPGRAWVPRVTDDDTWDYDPAASGIQRNPNMDRIDLDIFSDERYDDATTPAVEWALLTAGGAFLQAIQLGRQETLVGDPEYPDGDYLRCSGDILFDLMDPDPWTEADTPSDATDSAGCQLEPDEHGLAESVAFYKSATTVPFEWELASVLSVTEDSGEISITFDESSYAATFQPPSTCVHPWQTRCVCADVTQATCSLDANPYYLELGTTFGGDDIVSTWITAGACGPGGLCAVVAPSNIPGQEDVTDGTDGTPAQFLPGTLYYGRLWTQVRAADWGYVEFRVHQELPRVVGCDAEDPELAPPTKAHLSCPGNLITLTGSSSLFPGTPAIQVYLDPTGAAASRATAYFYDGLPFTGAPADAERLYGTTVFGMTEAGAEFCCHFDIPAGTVSGIDVLGGQHDDLVWFGLGTLLTLDGGAIAHLGASTGWGHDTLHAATADEAKVKFLGGLFSDRFITGERVFGVLDGGGGSDSFTVSTRVPPSGDPLLKMVVEGGGQGDFLAASFPSMLPDDPAPPVELWGGGGGNTLCADHGGTLMKGSSPSHGPNILYVSGEFASASPYTMNPGTSASVTGSSCGAPVHNLSLPGWAGPSCTLTQATLPTACLNQVDP